MGMEMCSGQSWNPHEEVVYDSNLYCPVCDMRDRLERVEQEVHRLQDKVEELEGLLEEKEKESNETS